MRDGPLRPAGPQRREGLRLAAATVLVASVGCATPSNRDLVRTVVEREQEAQSLAHAIIDMASEIRNRRAADRFFAAEVRSTAWPSLRGPARAIGPRLSWITRAHWIMSAKTVTTSAAGAARRLRRFVERLAPVTDLRLTIGYAQPAPSGALSAELKLSLYSRGGGKRRWTRGKARIVAEREGRDHWRISRLALVSLETLTSERAMFDEVGVPAGLRDVKQLMSYPVRAPMTQNGAVAVADVDGDGSIDALVTGPLRNVLLVNRGDGSFEPTDLLPGLPAQAALFADYDNDGDPDLFLSTFAGRQMLLENQRPTNGVRFTDVSDRLGAHRSVPGGGVVAADLNRDGQPDFYVLGWGSRRGPDRLDGAVDGHPNLLFISDGRGRYVEVARAWAAVDSRWSHAAQVADVDGDGRLDIYLANDFSGGNALLLNRPLRMLDDAKNRGVLDLGWGMGVSFGDYDNDGDLDLHVTRMSSTAGKRVLALLSVRTLPRKTIVERIGSGNRLYANDGRGRFRDVSEKAGPFRAGWAYGGGFYDFNNDGWEDLYTPSGYWSGRSMRDT